MITEQESRLTLVAHIVRLERELATAVDARCGDEMRRLTIAHEEREAKLLRKISSLQVMVNRYKRQLGIPT